MTVRGGDKIAAAANEIDNIYFIPSAPALLANRHTRYKYANYIIDVGGVYRTVLGRERVATMTAASSANERVSLSDAVFFFFLCSYRASYYRTVSRTFVFETSFQQIANFFSIS